MKSLPLIRLFDTIKFLIVAIYSLVNIMCICVASHNKMFHYIVPPPINLTYINDTMQLCKPIYPHGIILQYQIIAAMSEYSDLISASLNTSILNISTSLLLTHPGAYLVKVCNIHNIMTVNMTMMHMYVYIINIMVIYRLYTVCSYVDV